MTGGVGSTGLAIFEQTLLNLPQEEIDRRLEEARQEDIALAKVQKVKIDDLLKSPEQRKMVRINDITAARQQTFQRIQVLAGYSSRSISADVNAVRSALQRLNAEEITAQSVLKAIEAEMKSLTDGRQDDEDEGPIFDLPEGAVLEVEPGDMVVVHKKAPPTPTGRNGRELIKLGLLGYDGEWTGKKPDERYPKFVWRYFEKRRRDQVLPEMLDGGSGQSEGASAE